MSPLHCNRLLQTPCLVSCLCLLALAHPHPCSPLPSSVPIVTTVLCHCLSSLHQKPQNSHQCWHQHTGIYTSPGSHSHVLKHSGTWPFSLSPSLFCYLGNFPELGTQTPFCITTPWTHLTAPHHYPVLWPFLPSQGLQPIPPMTTTHLSPTMAKKQKVKPPKGRPASNTSLSHPPLWDFSFLALLSPFSPSRNLFALVSLAVGKNHLHEHDTNTRRSISDHS